MFEVKKLKEERAAVETMQAELKDKLEAEKRDVFTADEIERWDELETQKAELTSKIETQERLQRTAEIKTKRSEIFGVPAVRVSSPITSRDYNNAFRAWATYGRSLAKDDWMRSADRLAIDVSNREFRAQSSDVNDEGGYAKHDSLFQGLVEAKKAFGGIESVSEVITTDNDSNIHFATVDTTSQTATTSAQNETVDNTSYTLAKKTLYCWDYKTAVYPVSLQLIESANYDVAGHIGRVLGQRLARTLNADFTTGAGSGSSVARGVTLDTTEGTTGFSNNLNEQDLIDLYFSVDSEYRNSPNCVWMMGDLTLAHLVGAMVDGQGQPTWSEGLNAAPGQSILGKRVVINNDLDVMASGVSAQPMLFGDFSNFKIRYVGQPRIIRDDSRYIDQLAVGFFAWVRADSALVDAGTHPLKHLRTGTLSGD